MKPARFFRACATTVLSVIFVAVSPAARAATIYWDSTAGGWDSLANWTLSSNGSVNPPSAVPGSADTVIVGPTNFIVSATINLNANQSANGITHGNGVGLGSLTINSGNGTNTLTVGTGGLTETNNGQGFTINTGIVLAGNQTWTNSGQGLFINGTVTGAGNLILSGITTQSATAFNTTGSVTITGGNYHEASDSITGAVTASGGEFYTAAMFNGASGGVTLNGGTVGGHGTLIVSNAVSQNGTTNWYNNGGNNTFSGALTGGPSGTGVFNDIGTGTGSLTLSGTADNTNLSVSTSAATTYLDKTSSATVHAIGKALTVSAGSTTKIIGTGGYQLSGNATVAVNGTFDFNGDSESFDQLSGAATGIVTNTLASSTSTLAIGGNNGTSTFSGAIQNGAGGTGVVAINKNGTGTLTLNGNNTYTGATNVNKGTLTLGGVLGSGGGTAITVASGATLTETTAGSIQGGSSLIVNSNATVTLAGANTYTGSTTVNKATFSVDNGALTSASNGTVTPLASFSSNSAITLNNGSVLSSLGHTSGTAQSLSPATRAGGNYDGGIRYYGTFSNLTIGQAITINGVNTTIQGFSNGLIYLPNAVTAAGNYTATTSALTYLNSNTIQGLTLNPGASSVSASFSTQAGLTGVTGSNVLNLNAITRNVGSTVDFTLPTGTQSSTNGITTTTPNANFSGGQQTILGGWATVGGNTWAVSGSGGTPGNITGLSTYNAGFTAGTDVEAGNAVSTPGAMTINSLRFNTAGAATVNTSGNLVVATGGILETSTVGANAVAINNNTITSGNGQGLIINQNNTSGTMTVKSAITDNGGTSIGLTKTGSGAMSLSGTNTYTGATSLNGGTTSVTPSGTLGASGSSVTLRNGASLAFTNPGGQINLSTIGATATTSSGNATQGLAIDYIGGVPNTGTRWESAQSDPQWIYIDLKGTYNISSVSIYWEAANAKTMQLQTASSIALGNPNESGTGGNATNGWTTVLNIASQNPITNGYTTYNLPSLSSAQYIAMYGTARNLTYGYSLWDFQVFTQASALTQNIGSLSSSDATTSVSLDSLLTLNVGGDNTSTEFAGVISGAGILQKSGSGTLTLSGNNTYSGGTTATLGTLALSGNGTFGSGAVTSSGGTIDLGAKSITNTLGALTGGGSVNNGTITNNGGNYTVQSGSVGAVLAGTNGLAKSGNGTVTLTGTNTYSGTTTVSVGTLLVNNTSGSGTGTGNVIVDAGAILGGTGTIAPGAGNSISVSGEIAPGTAGSIGELTFNSASTTTTLATFQIGATFAFDLTTTGLQSDKVSLINGAAGDFQFHSNSIVFTVNGTLASGQAYTIFTADVADAYGGLQFTGNKVTDGLTFSGLGGAFDSSSYIEKSGFNLVLQVIPEPSTWTLLAFSLTTVMVFRRRRNS